MYRKDQIKGVIAIVLFGAIALSYFFFGKDISKWVAVTAILIWLSSMYLLNKKFKD